MTKLVKDLYAVLPGSVYPQTFESGSECPNELLHIAAKTGAIETKEPSKPAVKRNAPNNKAVGNAPNNKAVK